MAGVVGLRGARPDECAARGGVGFREEALERDFGKRRVGGEFRAVVEGEFLGFDEPVQGVGGVVASLRKIEALGDRAHLQGGDALTVGRKFVDVVAAVVDGNGIDPGGGVLLEIGLAEKAAVGAHEGIGFFRDLAAVVGVAAVLADQGERAGERGVFADLAFGGGEGVEEGAGELVELGVADADGPALGDGLGDGKTRLGVASGRSKD
jgi:hypothetical protein